VNALANSVASVVQNWTQENPRKSPKNTSAPLTSIETATSTRDGVQSTELHAHAKTTVAWVSRPSRRRVNWSAQTWTSSGTGFVIIWSRRPVRM
jgi:hypothetical protein